MKGHREIAEVIVRLDQLAGEANICVSAWPSMARKMVKLYGIALPKSGANVQYWKVPLKCISFRRRSTAGKATRINAGGFKRGNKPQSEELNRSFATLLGPSDILARQKDAKLDSNGGTNER